MNIQEDFLEPRCATTRLDNYGVRRAIVEALRSQLPLFSGTVADIGCGHMPYRSLVLASPSRANQYIGIDLKENIYRKPDLEWDGCTLPLDDGTVNIALATELFEHCPSPEMVMKEAFRVLQPGGLLFFTVPFLWPLHDVPHDEYRYTPFALERHLRDAGFEEVVIRALGGWDASLAQMIGLWVRRSPMTARTRALLSWLALPIVRYLFNRDSIPQRFEESSMCTGFWGTAKRSA
ncbi:class I SAM-dependent methyltransferase [Petrachloros mirabilis]